MATAVRDPWVGTLVGARYQVRSRIASGGMGTVYLALDTRLDREVALKVMHSHLAADTSFVERFTREARAAARLSHPGVVAVFDQGADDGAVYLAMEHVPGRTLRDVLAARGALRLREALDVAEEVLAALGAAHGSGLVHRDVKPENILIGADGRLRLVDFGLARAASSSGSATSTLIGTVGYLAPELLASGASDARADVYAVGVVLVELLTGAPPFSGSAPAQVAYRHVHEDVPAPSDVRPDLPAVVDDLVRWATARDPEHRPADADELLAAVRRVRAGLDEQALDAAPRVDLAAAGPAPDEREVAGTVVAPAPLPPTAVAPQLTPGPTPARAGSSRAGSSTEGSTGSPRPGRRRVLPVAAGLLVLALAATWLLTLGPLARAVVPRVAGGTAAQAQQALAAHHLGRAREVLRYSATREAGRVVAVVPGAGTSVRRGTHVRLVVSRGPQLFTVPVLTGLTRTAAEAAVRAAGLGVGTVAQDWSDTVAAGAVVSQQTPAGKELTARGRVDLTVSKGRQPIDVPSVVGQAQDAATTAITEAGLAVGTVSQQPSASVPAGSVVSQAPTGGTLFARDQVSLVVSSGPPVVTVPSVVGQDVQAATAQLTALGLKADVQEVFGAPFGQVREQDPSGGTLPAGSTVTLKVF